jgi:hypothetical protein
MQTLYRSRDFSAESLYGFSCIEEGFVVFSPRLFRPASADSLVSLAKTLLGSLADISVFLFNAFGGLKNLSSRLIKFIRELLNGRNNSVKSL